MVEIKSQENNTVKLPNNIRQVGTPGEKTKIYIEDYVMTYLNQLTAEKPVGQKAALLLGEKVKKDNADIYFVSAAIEVRPVDWKEDRFKLTTDEWSALYDKVNQYFKNRHMLGWFLSRPGQAAAADGQIEKIHTDNFQDKGSLFYTVDPLDREDAFYLYENGHLFRQHGYYIYYERNEAMQNYMIEIRQDNRDEGEGTPGFQSRLFEKKTDHRIRKEAVNRKRSSKSMRWVPQVAVLALILIVIGVRRNMPGLALPVSQNRVAEVVSGETQTESVTSTDYTGHLDIVESIVQQAEQATAEREQAEQAGNNVTAAGESNSEQNTVENNENNGNGEENSTAAQTEVSEDETSENGTEVMGSAYRTYTVKEGDTLLKISRSYYQDAAHVETIRQLNQIENPDYIYPGMILKLP